jgi:hypothetical protein
MQKVSARQIEVSGAAHQPDDRCTVKSVMAGRYCRCFLRQEDMSGDVRTAWKPRVRRRCRWVTCGTCRKRRTSSPRKPQRPTTVGKTVGCHKWPNVFLAGPQPDPRLRLPCTPPSREHGHVLDGSICVTPLGATGTRTAPMAPTTCPGGACLAGMLCRGAGALEMAAHFGGHHISHKLACLVGSRPCLPARPSLAAAPHLIKLP